MGAAEDACMLCDVAVVNVSEDFRDSHVEPESVKWLKESREKKGKHDKCGAAEHADTRFSAAVDEASSGINLKLFGRPALDELTDGFYELGGD